MLQNHSGLQRRETRNYATNGVRQDCMMFYFPDLKNILSIPRDVTSTLRFDGSGCVTFEGAISSILTTISQSLPGRRDILSMCMLFT